jgi:beta-lactamase class C
MKKSNIIILLSVLTFLLSIYVIEMPAIHSTPHPKQPGVIRSVNHQPLTSVSAENPHIQQLLAEYEVAINNLMITSQTPGAAIAIVKDSSIIYLKGFGVKAYGTKDSVDTETVFRLGSVSKCFAPMLTGLLVEDKVLAWNDKVIKYLPGFALQSKEQTDQLLLRHVLSHTVGLPYHTYTNLIEEGETLPSMLSKLKDINMIGTVGHVYSYQNVAYSIIGEVIHAASGKSYENLMTERIFAPLHMDQASISYADIMKNTNVARPHKHLRSGMAITSINDTYYNVAPAGGVNASASDMALWIEALLGNRKDIVTDKTLNEIFTPVIHAPSKNRNFRRYIHQTDSYYALGWRVLDSKTDTLFYHGGYVNGYRSELAINRKDKIGICILTNSTGALADNSAPYFFNLYLLRRDSIQQWENRHRMMANTK